MIKKVIRGTSDLSEIKNITDDDLIEISERLQEGKYSSRKMTFGTLKNVISEIADETTQDKFNLKQNTDVGEIVDFTNTISSSIEINPSEIKMDKVVLLNQTSENMRSVQTRQQILQLLEEENNYISQDTKIGIYPGNENGYTRNYEYMWNIDTGAFDSSETIMESGNKQRVVMKDTGYLTMYGWLASNANIQPQNAWVGLYAKMFCEETKSEQWILLQMQPWILGENCQIMQYVGFNVPVKRGLELKVMTGFPVNGSASGLQGYDHNLLLTDVGNTVNTFVGYVMKTSI